MSTCFKLFLVFNPKYVKIMHVSAWDGECGYETGLCVRITEIHVQVPGWGAAKATVGSPKQGH